MPLSILFECFIVHKFSSINLVAGSVIFINHEGKSFRHLKDVEELTIDIDGGPKTISKVSLAHVSDNHFDIMLINNDQTFGMVEVYHTDLNSWIA